MRLILLGAPGAGKGTQAAIISEKYDIPHISTGDILRGNIKLGTDIGKQAQGYIDKGMLVPDGVAINIIKERITRHDCKNGFILDGFPRTIAQAKELDILLEAMGKKIDSVINLDVPEARIIKRLSGRRVCHCGKTYHIRSNPPKNEGVCDKCSGRLFQREDDKEDTIIKRLDIYHKQTEPLIEYYTAKGKLITIEGMVRIEDTAGKVTDALNGVENDNNKNEKRN
ncbi:MAG: adenylate kinase [Clostridium sp.]|nr:adenylate kinase [Clostridium sp.]